MPGRAQPTDRHASKQRTHTHNARIAQVTIMYSITTSAVNIEVRQYRHSHLAAAAAPGAAAAAAAAFYLYEILNDDYRQFLQYI